LYAVVWSTEDFFFFLFFDRKKNKNLNKVLCDGYLFSLAEIPIVYNYLFIVDVCCFRGAFGDYKMCVFVVFIG